MRRLEKVMEEVNEIREQMEETTRIILEVSPGIRLLEEANEHAQQFVLELEELVARFKELLREQEELEKEEYRR